MTLSEKVAYFKGLVEGLSLERDSREGKLWLSLSDLISDLSAEIKDLKDTTDGFADTFEEINSELSYLEETAECNVPKAGGNEFYDDDCEDCDGDCEACGKCGYAEDDEGDSDTPFGFADLEKAMAGFRTEPEYKPPKTADGFISYVNNDLPEEEPREEESEEQEEEPESEEKPEDEDACKYSITCPLCGRVFGCSQKDIDKGSIPCPGCNKQLIFDFEQE